MLSISTIARVVVSASRSVSVPTSFDTGLLLIKDANYAAAKRLKTYNSAAEAAAGLVADGFAASTEAYKAAVKYFAQSPAPGRLLVSCYSSSETPADALAAVLDITSDFYGVCLGASETDANILALEAAVSASEKPCMLFLPLIGTLPRSFRRTACWIRCSPALRNGSSQPMPPRCPTRLPSWAAPWGCSWPPPRPLLPCATKPCRA